MTAFILQCNRCKWFHAYRVNRRTSRGERGGIYRIDTICSVCGARLRHTQRRHGWRWNLKTVAPANAKGSGGHNQQTSVLTVIPSIRSNVYVETRRLNKERQRRMAERDGMVIEEE